MEAFVFNITLPTDWSQLTDKQLTFLFEQLSKNRPAYDVETRCLLKWAQLVILDQLPDGSFLVRRHSHHPRIPIQKETSSGRSFCPSSLRSHSHTRMD